MHEGQAEKEGVVIRMNIIEVIDLCYQYSEEAFALDHINLSFEQGRMIGVLGGNGAGKSTLFLNLNGVLKPDSGKVLFQGKEIVYSKKEILQLRKQIGIVFQDPEDQLFSSSVRKDISFGLMNQGVPAAEVNQKVEDILKELGICDIAEKPTHALSFGQKKKVAIAGVLVMQPTVIILDEPTAGLDPCGVSEILDLVKKINKEMGITVILSTHDIDLIPLYCDDVFVLHQGKKIYEGTPDELFSNPELLREHNLRLPRIAHLMGILYDRDHLKVDKSASTIAKARKSIKGLVEAEHE